MNSTSVYKVFFGVGLLFLLSLSVYGNTLNNGFVFDDNEQIVHNQWIKDYRHIPDIFTSGVWSFREPNKNIGIYYRPLMHVFFMVEYYFFGLNPFGYHAINIILHFLDSVLLFVFLLVFIPKIVLPHDERGMWGGIFGLAILSAVIFSLYPINTEVVNWISAMPELSFTFFYLLALSFYFVSHERKIYFFLSLLFFILSLLCKETAVTLPLLLFLYHFLLQDTVRENIREKIKRCFFAVAPFFVISLIFVVARTMILGINIDDIISHNFFAFVLIELIMGIIIFVRSIMEILFPFKQSIFHSFQPTDMSILYVLAVIVPPLLFLSIVFKKYIKIRVSKVVIWSSILFLVPLLPALNYFYLNVFLLSERYLYVPSMGFSLFVAFFILRGMSELREDLIKKNTFLFRCYKFVYCVCFK